MIIAFEGIDACGKQTQVKILQDFIKATGHPVTAFNFPNYKTETGAKILKLLKEPSPDPLILQSLMTVNRYEVQAQIKWAGDQGHVILDRYWFSGLVYGVHDGLDQNWLVEVHRSLIQPDHFIVLDITAEESFRRRPHRDDAYEADKDRIENVRELYLDLSPLVSTTDTEVSTVNGEQSAREVASDVLSICDLAQS